MPELVVTSSAAPEEVGRRWSERGWRLLSKLPSYHGRYGENPPHDDAVHAVLEPLARELGRFEDLLIAFRDEASNVNRMTDRFGLLRYWEGVYTLPSDDATPLSLEVRRQRVAAARQGLRIGSGLRWTEQAEAFAGRAIEVEENGYQLTVTVAGGDDAFLGAFENFLRKITPAHLSLTVTNTEGFVVGSGVGTPI